jgi:hypothetical protein
MKLWAFQWSYFCPSSGHEIVTREKQPKKYGQNGDDSCFNICFPTSKSYELHTNYKKRAIIDRNMSSGVSKGVPRGWSPPELGS